MSKDLGVPVSNVVRDGLGLAFIAYPEAISRMPISPLWSVLFFFMLVTLGLDSMFATCETITTAIQDQFRQLRRHTPWVVLCTCVVSYIIALPMCTRAGVYVFTLLNDYSAGYSVMLLAFLEVATTMWIYGIKKFVKDIQLMLGAPTGPISRFIGPTGFYWQFMWFLVSPVFLLAIAVLSLIFYRSSSYGDYKFPYIPEMFGWLISVGAIILVPIFAIYRILTNRSQAQPFSALFQASIEWCPAEQRAKLTQNDLIQLNPYTISTDRSLNGDYINNAFDQRYQLYEEGGYKLYPYQDSHGSASWHPGYPDDHGFGPDSLRPYGNSGIGFGYFQAKITPV